MLTNVLKIGPVIESEKLLVYSLWFTGRTGGRTAVEPVMQ